MNEAINTIREEELKNILRDSFFSDYDATPILGDVDFAVTSRRENPAQTELFEREWFLWAESKKGSSHSLIDSFIQLIITIGKAHTHEKNIPPKFLGAFDAEKIAFIEFHHVVSVFYQNDFNWNVTPSNHSTKEFKLLKEMLKSTLNEHIATFNLKKDEKLLRQFIKKNFRDGSKSGVSITRNNYLFVFQRWVEDVRPTIDADWGDIPAARVADFFFADLISRGDYTLRSDLAVVLRGDEYKILEQILQSGRALFSECFFTDGMKAYRAFWNKYKRPPRQEAIDIILERRDLLIPHNLRQYQGAFFTPPQWVELSQRYLADEFGENWQQEYYVWDCCAGTGNLLFGLTEPYRVWASTLDHGDVQVMKNRAADGELNLLEKHIFKFDFLNNDFKNLPESLRKIIEDPKDRKKLIIYINPPYAEVSTKAIDTEGKKTKKNVNQSMVHSKYQTQLGTAGRELFAQFLIRIYSELTGVNLANFSTLKNLQGSAFATFRNYFTPILKRLFGVPANTFDNVNGQFSRGFFIWDTSSQVSFLSVEADVYNRDGEQVETKHYQAYRKKDYINNFISIYKNDGTGAVGFLDGINSNDFQHNNYVYIVNTKSQVANPRGIWINKKNLIPCCIYISVRKVIEATWLNDRDQFLNPSGDWQSDYEFQIDCLVFALFINNIRSTQGINHWIPFSEQEVGAQDNYHSHFLIEFLKNESLTDNQKENQFSLFEQTQQEEKVHARPLDNLSNEAKAVMDAGRDLWSYYHSKENSNPNASYYDIRLYFQGTKVSKSGKEQMNTESSDDRYTNLNNNLKQAMRQLAAHIEPKVYQYGFLK